VFVEKLRLRKHQLPGGSTGLDDPAKRERGMSVKVTNKPGGRVPAVVVGVSFWYWTKNPIHPIRYEMPMWFIGKNY